MVNPSTLQQSEQQISQYCFLDICIIISHRIFLHVSIDKGSSGNQTKSILHKTKLASFVRSRHCIEESNSKNINNSL
jgi:hypothetical protein